MRASRKAQDLSIIKADCEAQSGSRAVAALLHHVGREELHTLPPLTKNKTRDPVAIRTAHSAHPDAGENGTVKLA